MRSSINVISLLALGSFSVYADSASQTDWSGGPGVLGPIMQWGDEFYSCNNLVWSGITGFAVISLLGEYLERSRQLSEQIHVEQHLTIE